MTTTADISWYARAIREAKEIRDAEGRQDATADAYADRRLGGDWSGLVGFVPTAAAEGTNALDRLAGHHDRTTACRPLQRVARTATGPAA